GCVPVAATSGTPGSARIAPEPSRARFATFPQMKSVTMRKPWDSKSPPEQYRRRPFHARARGGFQSTKQRDEKKAEPSPSSDRDWSNHPIAEDALVHETKLP